MCIRDSSNTNFVLVNQGRGTVQVAFNTVYPGPNGIGGVTVDGTTSDMKITCLHHSDSWTFIFLSFWKSLSI